MKNLATLSLVLLLMLGAACVVEAELDVDDQAAYAVGNGNGNGNGVGNGNAPAGFPGQGNGVEDGFPQGECAADSECAEGQSCVDAVCVDCVYDGTGYFIEDWWAANDGCNRCKCMDVDFWACTLMWCAP